jgi:solute carrier family 20 (sodium-dependent phosphate transporter)
LFFLAGCAIWLAVATFFRVPVSTTHSIVGATVGFSLVAKGTLGLSWMTLGTIVASWFVSPILSGGVSVLLYWLIKKLILNSSDPFKAGLISLPIIYGLTIFINVFSVVHEGPKCESYTHFFPNKVVSLKLFVFSSVLYMDNIMTWVAVVISIGVGLLFALLIQFILVPRQRKRILADRDLPKTTV